MATPTVEIKEYPVWGNPLPFPWSKLMWTCSHCLFPFTTLYQPTRFPVYQIPWLVTGSKSVPPCFPSTLQLQDRFNLDFAGWPGTPVVADYTLSSEPGTHKWAIRAPLIYCWGLLESCHKELTLQKRAPCVPICWDDVSCVVCRGSLPQEHGGIRLGFKWSSLFLSTYCEPGITSDSFAFLISCKPQNFSAARLKDEKTEARWFTWLLKGYLACKWHL